MQTFLPSMDFDQSAAMLDSLRLGKQIMEAGQILRSLATGTGWHNHPATKMWAGHEAALYDYATACNDEWETRPRKDGTMRDRHGAYSRIEDEFGIAGKIIPFAAFTNEQPEWMGGKIHVTHQSNLVRKDPEHYRTYFPDVPDDLEYYWPV